MPDPKALYKKAKDSAGPRGPAFSWLLLYVYIFLKSFMVFLQLFFHILCHMGISYHFNCQHLNI